MKKTLSLILCLLMVFGSFAGALTASAEVTGKNLWTDISVDDFGTKDVDGVIPKFEEGKNNYGKKFTVTDAYHTSFYIEMPELDANTIYDLSFKYDNHIIENKPGKINSVSIVTEEEMAQITDAGGSKLPSTATTIGSALELDKGEYTDLSATFTTGATKTKHYLYFRTGYAYWFYLCDFKLVKVPTYNVTVEGGTADKVEAKAGETVTITATPAKTQAFYYWEVTSGNVELSDTFSKTATFTMPAEDVTVEAVFLDNLWSNISADDWFTRQVSTKVDDPLTLEEKKMTDVYPEKFTYTEDGSFSLQTAGSKFYYVKLPELAKNTEYTLSLDYSATKANASLTPNLYKVILMPESGFTNQYTWNGYGDMLSGRSFLGAYDVCLNKALSENELNSTLTYDFNSKTKTQYYLFFHFSNIGNITYSNFKLTECPLYGITVDGGTASLTSAKKGAEVTITANEPQNGMVFDHFEVVSGGVTLADPYSPTTTFTMGNFGVNIKAVYREYGAKIVYLNTDGTPYADSANIGGAKIEITENSDGTETITLSYDKMDNVNTFIGWYKGEELLEKGESFTYNPEETDISTLSAKIITRNVLMGAAGFESYSNNTSLRVEPVATGVLPYDERWGLIQGSNYEAENIGFYIKTTEAKQSTYYTDIGFDPETSTNAPEADRKVAKFDVAPYSGNSMLELSAAYRSFVRKIDGLKPNTNYTLSMYVLTPDEYNFLSSAVIANGYTERPSRLQVMSKQMIKSSKLKIYGFYEEPRTQELFEVNVTPKDKSAIRNWKKSALISQPTIIQIAFTFI